MKLPLTAIAATAGLAMCASARADVTITQGATAPVYSGNQITFDEVGDPVGAIANDAYLASHGVSFMAGTGEGGVVQDWDAVYGPWGLGSGNSHWGNFGTFVSFTEDLTEMSFDAWNNDQDPFFGGISIIALNDGVEVANMFTMPSWAGVGDAGFNITTTGGDVFDEVRIIDWGFSSFGMFTDNYSWNAVPAPGALALLGLAGVAGRRRRRS